jgi:LuxR family maltose regulon positive regulatory protein
LERLDKERPCVLVIDDFHLITEAAIVDCVVRLARHLPSQVRLLVAGRAIPQFSLQWLLLNGVAAAVTDADLRFTAEEAAAFVALVAGKFLLPDQAVALTERSEGWAAGIHLAATAMTGGPEPSECIRLFSGAFGPVADYLDHEMLAPEPPDVVQFLLETSVLEYLTPDLCRSVTGRDDAGGILESLARRNLFLIPTGPYERTYRYHRLFADLLICRLQLEDPEVARGAHINAAKWFESRGKARAAATHFAQARAYDRALVLAFSDLLHPIDGRPSAGRDEFFPASLPEVDVDRDPGRTYAYAAALLCSMRIAEAAQLLQRLDTITANESDRRLWRGRVEFLWAIHAERLADAPSTLDHCRAMTDLMGSVEVGGPSAITGSQAASSWSETIDAAISEHAPMLAARAHVWLDQPDQAQSILVRHFGTEERAQASQPATLAMMAARQGRLRHAYRFATAALQRAAAGGRADDLVTLDARLALADVYFEQDELELAQTELEAALQLCRSAGGSDWEWAAEADLVRLMIAQERPGEALNRLGHLRHIEGRHPPAHHLQEKLNYVEILCRIALGDLEGTLLVARSMSMPEVSREVLARIDLFAGRPDRALSRLTAGPLPKIGAEIRRLILLACAEMQRGRTQLAEDSVRRALDTGRPEGFVRPFLEGGPQIASVLRGIVATRPDPYVAHLVCQAKQVGPGRTVVAPVRILEPLTDRERELLGYLPSHLHLREIADSMYVSLNTVKTHLKNIYRKLGATSRSEAVSVARIHGLL